MKEVESNMRVSASATPGIWTVADAMVKFCGVLRRVIERSGGGGGEEG